MVPFPGGGSVTGAGCASGTVGCRCGSPAPRPQPGLAQRCRSTGCQTQPGPLRNLCLKPHQAQPRTGSEVQTLPAKRGLWSCPPPRQSLAAFGYSSQTKSTCCWRAHVPGLPLSDSPVGKLGNLLFPNLFFFLGNSVFALLSGEQNPNPAASSHTHLSLLNTRRQKPSFFPRRKPGLCPAAAPPPPGPGRAVTCALRSLPAACAASRGPADPASPPGRTLQPGPCTSHELGAAPLPRGWDGMGQDRMGWDRTGLAPCPEMPQRAGAGRRPTGSTRCQKLPEPNSAFRVPLLCRFTFSAKMSASPLPHLFSGILRFTLFR